MAKLREFKADLTKEAEGIWNTYTGTDVECLIARVGNPEFQRARRRALKDAKVKAAASGQLTEAQSKDAMAPTVARFILLGWKNIEDDDGNAIEYSVDAAVKLLRDPEFHDWYDWILTTANDGMLYRHDEVDEDELGNSETPSTGT